jgi:hypothetical protein
MKQRTFVQRKAILGNAEHAGRIWRSTLGFLAYVVVLIVAISVLPFIRWQLLLIGFVLGTAVTVIVLAILRVSDPVVHGSWAEQSSLESLRKVPSWLVTENLPFSDVDVDHVVVAPACVLAIETKYRGRVSTGSLAAERHQRELDATLGAARKVSSFLSSCKLSVAPEVTPVLMVWGPGKPDLPNGAREERRVIVVDAANPQVWSHRFAAPRLQQDSRQEIHQAITKYIAVRHGYEANKLPALRLEMWSEFRRGIHEEKERRYALRELKASTSRRHAAK